MSTIRRSSKAAKKKANSGAVPVPYPNAGARSSTRPSPNAGVRQAARPSARVDVERKAEPQKPEESGGVIGSLIDGLLGSDPPKKRKPRNLGIHGGKSIHDR